MKLIRDVRNTVLSRFGALALSILAGIIVSRALQPAGKGIYVSVLAFTDLAIAFGALGLGKAALVFIGRNAAPHPVIARTVLTSAVVNGAVVATLCLLFGGVLRHSTLRDVPPEAFSIAVVLCFVGIVFGYSEGLLRGLQRVSLCNRALLTQVFIFFALVGTSVLYRPLTPVLVLSYYLIAQVASAVMVLIPAGRVARSPGPLIDRSLLRKMLGYGLVYQLYAFIQLAHHKIDIFIVAHFLTTQDVGLYATAVSVAGLIYNIPLAIGTVLTPWAASREEGDAYLGTARVARSVFVILSVLGAMAAVFAPVFVRILYGDAYLPAVPSLRILLPGIIGNGVFLTLTSYLLGKGRLGLLTGVCGSTVVLNVTLNLLLIPRWGIAGAAASSSVTYSLVAVGTGILYLRQTRASVSLLLPTRSDVSALVSALTGGRWSQRAAVRPGIQREAV